MNSTRAEQGCSTIPHHYGHSGSRRRVSG
jgi:hypothetical protein